MYNRRIEISCIEINTHFAGQKRALHVSECGSDLPRTCPATPSGQNGRVSLVGVLQQQNGVPTLVRPRLPLLPCQQRLGGEMLVL